MRRGPNIFRQRGQVLIILFFSAMLFGGSAAGLGWIYGGNNFEQLRKQLKQVVPDEQRRKPLGQVLEQLQGTAEGYAGSHERQVRRLLEVLERHDGTPAEVDRILGDVDSLNAFSRKSMVDLRYQLRSGLSAEEWASLFPPPESPAP